MGPRRNLEPARSGPGRAGRIRGRDFRVAAGPMAGRAVDAAARSAAVGGRGGGWADLRRTVGRLRRRAGRNDGVRMGARAVRVPAGARGGGRGCVRAGGRPGDSSRAGHGRRAVRARARRVRDRGGAGCDRTSAGLVRSSGGAARGARIVGPFCGRPRAADLLGAQRQLRAGGGAGRDRLSGRGARYRSGSGRRRVDGG